MTTGMKTSEFWVMVITALVNLANQFLGWEIDATDLATASAPLMVYAVARGLAKWGSP